MPKNYFSYLLSLLILISACSLEEDPKSLITPDEFFNESRDAKSSVDAIYININSGNSVYAKYCWLVHAMASDLGSDDGSDPDIAEFSNFNITPENRIVHEIWRGLYHGINQANFAIENIPNAPISEDEQLPLLAEARFLRAFFYFDLMRYFGEVPLVLESTSKTNQVVQMPRAVMVQLESFIEEEFNFAFENLPSTSNPGRPTRITAAGLLCKYYLTTKNFSRAFQASRIVIQEGQLSLLNDYANLFKANSQNNREFLWSVNLNASDGSPINVLTLPDLVGGRSQVFPSDDFYEAFEDLDRRAAVTLQTSFSDRDGGLISLNPHMVKYWDPVAEPEGGPSGMDIPLLRFADILLMHAESLNELRNGTSAEALNVINMVRTRARFDGFEMQDILPDLGRMNKSEFRKAILDERKRELGWEGHRWFDLVRFQLLEEEVINAKPDAAVSATHLLMPIPSQEFLLNPLLGRQNPGY